MNTRERGTKGMQTGVVLIVLGTVRFVISVIIDGKLDWSCLLIPSGNCDYLMPSYGPGLIQMGVVGVVIGLAMTLYADYRRS